MFFFYILALFLLFLKFFKCFFILKTFIEKIFIKLLEKQF